MKIKTFHYFVSNSQHARMLTHSDSYESRYDHPTVASFSDIDDEINEFISQHAVWNVMINDFTSHRHNNAGADLVERTYTILYQG